MQNEGDHRRADPVEDRCHRWKALEPNVERAEGGDDDEVGQDKRPAAGPRPPKATADVRDPNANLDGERSRQGLTDGDALPHLVLSQPLPLADHLPLHLADERDGAPEAEQTQPQVVLDELADGDAPRGLVRFHQWVLLRKFSQSVTLDESRIKRYGETRGAGAGMPGDPCATRPVPVQSSRLRRPVAREAGRTEARAGPDPSDRLSGGAGRSARPDALGDNGEASARSGAPAPRGGRPAPSFVATPRQYLGDPAAAAHRPDRVRLAHQALL